MAFDPAMALQIKVPEQDLGKMIGTANAAIKLRGMQDYRAALDAGASPEQASRILARTDPEMAGQVSSSEHTARTTEYRKRFGQSGNLEDVRGDPESYEVSARGSKTDYDLKSEHLQRAAYDVLHEKDPVRKKQKWQMYGDYAAGKKWIDPQRWAQVRDQTPDNNLLQGIIRNSISVPTQMGVTGQAAGNEAAAVAPYKVEVTEPGKTVIQPGNLPGAPTYGQPKSVPGDYISSPPDYGPRPIQTVPLQRQPGGPPAPAGPVAPPPVPGRGSMVGTGGESIMPGQGAPPAAAPPVQVAQAPAVTPPAPAAKGNKEDKYFNEAPAVHVSPMTPEGDGVLIKGTHPLAVRSAELAHKVMEEDINPAASSASKSKSSLGIIENTLKSGKTGTSQIADFKLMLGGVLSVMVGPEQASKTVGMDIKDTEAMKKEMVKNGLNYDRQTLGAREAVMAINIGLGANPQMMNTTPGNLKIIQLLKAGSDYDIERGKAAQAYFQKQQKETGTGHLIGFDSWFNKEHSPASFTSKIIPYPIEEGMTKKDLVPNVTYAVPIKDADGHKIPLLDKEGKPTGQFKTETLKFNGTVFTNGD